MLSSFPQFSMFPKEVQLVIWESFAAYSIKPQVLEGLVQDQHDYNKDGADSAEKIISIISDEEDSREDEETNDVVATPPNISASHTRILAYPAAAVQTARPVMLYVCQLSRQVALSLGRFTELRISAEDNRPRLFWFNFTSDTVFLPDLDPLFHEDEQWTDIANEEDCKRIEHLAVPWSVFHGGSRGSNDYYEQDKSWWASALRLLCWRFPRLANLYLCIPVVRLRQNDYMSEVGVHFAEPEGCEGLQIALESMSGTLDRVKLPFCDCEVKPETMAATLTEIDRWLQSEIVQQALSTIPNRVQQAGMPFHLGGKWLVRKGLDMDKLCQNDFSVVVDDGWREGTHW
ncbi:uncharacterized protein CTRU02_200997 [Colletotrichum truncatum]|uniref:Uncharacterized protein n=1 Tax=Colletotrichum truncatum TaxID=5467 RepID=A0ACC3ZG79_COLTU|nr:uncharacterized protein CTRU02_00768 [Colletotrichum truncatum]KAF6802019.1 hypothetical protein CTRU02_00768 [Colletotrichum truncatum]